MGVKGRKGGGKVKVKVRIIIRRKGERGKGEKGKGESMLRLYFFSFFFFFFFSSLLTLGYLSYLASDSILSKFSSTPSNSLKSNSIPANQNQIPQI